MVLFIFPAGKNGAGRPGPCLRGGSWPIPPFHGLLLRFFLFLPDESTHSASCRDLKLRRRQQHFISADAYLVFLTIYPPLPAVPRVSYGRLFPLLSLF